MTPRATKTFWTGTVVIIAVIWTALVVAARWAGNRLNANPPRPVVDETAGSPTLQSLWPVPVFSFTDQDDKKFTDADLRGHVSVIDFIYTQCTTACPVLSAKMVLLQKAVADPSVKFVSISVDPAHDTPAALKAYRELWHGDPNRWSLLSTDQTGLDKIVNGMHVIAEHQNDPVNPIVHSDLFFLVDKTGTVRGLYSSNSESQMTRLQMDIGTITGPTRVDTTMPTDMQMTTAVQRGRALSLSLGCMACHTRPAIAPPLAGLANSPVKLDDNRVVWADEPYLRESITAPSAKVVQGYTKTMPSYAGRPATEQADLVAWLMSGADATTGTASTAPVELLTDPVCQMKVTVDATTPKAIREGKTYYFCSETCRDKFIAQKK